jgi:uncharacterized protein (DUF2267 family)
MLMDELIKLVTTKAGISEAQAKKAVETVLGFLKDKLPGPLADQIDGLLKGNVGDVTKGLGGLLKK